MQFCLQLVRWRFFGDGVVASDIKALPTVLACITLLGCGEVAPPRSGVTVDTLPSGVVRVRNPDPIHTDAVPTWTLVEQRYIGELDGTSAAVFGDIRDMLVDPAGRVFVLEYHSQQVRVFDSIGAHLFSFGGRGSGPGELRGANGLAWSVDGHIWVTHELGSDYAAA